MLSSVELLRLTTAERAGSWILVAACSMALCTTTTACSDSMSLGVPATAQIVAGDNKTDSVGGTFVDTEVVWILDASGNAIPNVAVNWAASSGTLDHASSVTNKSGFASVIWTFSFAPTAPVGSTTTVVTATADSLTATDVVNAGPGNPIPTIVEGDHQSGVVGTMLPTPLKIHVADQHGNPLTDGQVTWSAAGDMLQLTPGSTSTLATTVNTYVASDGTTQVYLTPQKVGANDVAVHVVGLWGESRTSHPPFNLTFPETASASN